MWFKQNIAKIKKRLFYDLKLSYQAETNSYSVAPIFKTDGFNRLVSVMRLLLNNDLFDTKSLTRPTDATRSVSDITFAALIKNNAQN